MPESADQFQNLMARVLARSETAAEELLKYYEPYLLRAIRKRLSRKMRSKFDSVDFTQDVWASFFAELPVQNGFAGPDDLAKFLAKIAQHKVIDAMRHRHCQKRNLARERSLDDSRQGIKDALVGHQDTPSEIVSTEDEWHEFLRRQPLVYRQVFVWLREGRTAESIAQELDISVRTVGRLAAQRQPKLTS